MAIMNNSTNGLMRSVPVFSVGLFSLIHLTGVVGNVLLIIAHMRDPLKLLKASSSLFILNIAFLDFLISCFTIMALFFSVFADGSDAVSKSTILSKADILLASFFAMSITSYLSLAIERFCSVAFPFWHRVNVTTRVCRHWVVGIWLVAIVLEVCFNVAAMHRKEFQLRTLDMAHVVFIWLMFLLTQCVYIASYRSIRNQNRELKRRGNMSETTARTIKIRLKNENNFLLTTAIICFVLAVSILPFMTISFIIILEAIISKKTENEKNDVPSYYIWSILTFGVNSSINVFVYLWRFQKYRKTFKKLFCPCWKR